MNPQNSTTSSTAATSKNKKDSSNTMEKYFQKKARTTSMTLEETESGGSKLPQTYRQATVVSASQPSFAMVNQSANPLSSESPLPCDESEWKVDGITLLVDPGLRGKLSIYHPNLQDEIRRSYLLKGACQPRGHDFPFTAFGERNRRFNPKWFDQYKWLEYSISKNVAFCLYCYLFRHEVGNKGGGDSFIGKGFDNWTKSERFEKHVDLSNSAHNDCRIRCEALMQQSQSIHVALEKQSDQAKMEYRIRLEASVDCIMWLLHNGLSFRGHDESEESSHRGLFLSLLEFHTRDRENIKNVVLGNAPKNLQLTSPKIQKDIVHAMALETTKLIIKDIGDDFFSILVDESRDSAVKEQMAIVIRYVNGEGCIVERFLSISHVKDTKAVTLKNEIVSMLSKHGLSISKLRGQGYDGASNMKGSIKGLKTLILEESPSAYYIHCFAHQLQLTLVAVAKNHDDVSVFFYIVSMITNLVGASCKRVSMIREIHADKVAEAIALGELQTGRGLNQELGSKRPSDTRWGSHFATLINLEIKYSTLLEVMEAIEDDDAKAQANLVSEKLQTFNFAFMLKLLIEVLSITNELSVALQRKEQDIVNAMLLVKVAKQRLQQTRDTGWDSLLDEVVTFCSKLDITIPEMDAAYVGPKKSKRKSHGVSNLHHFKIEVFYTIVDMQLQEMNSRFDEVNCQLLLSMACLSPANAFAAFDRDKLLHLATFYPNEFCATQLKFLQHQLTSYIHDVLLDERFKDLNGIDELAKKLVETRKHILFPLVYLLLKLTLILPVATASVERAFSAMNYIKNDLRNRMGDEWMNDSLVAYIERDLFATVDKECILQSFQKMKTRRGSL